MRLELAVRLLGMLVLGYGAFRLGEAFALDPADPGSLRALIALTLAGAGIGLLVTPYVTVRPLRRIRDQLRVISAQDLVAGTVGLVIGLVIAALLALPLSLLPAPFGQLLPFLASLALGYFGATVMVWRKQELAQFLTNPWRLGGRSGAGYVLVDTSVLIDGRVEAVYRAGFIPGTLLIPHFVLDELQQVADSPDPIRRGRGRRGLSVLNRLRRDPAIGVKISELDAEGAVGVDEKLVELARTHHWSVLTCDANLQRVAEIRGVKVLNLNELANALRPMVMTGDELTLRIVQEGKESGQGIGYLDDGTMVVVEGGRRHIGSEVSVVVTRVLQTQTGRMVFAQLKEGVPARG